VSKRGRALIGLLSASTACATARATPSDDGRVDFSHLYGVLDQETADAVLATGYLSDVFTKTERRTTSADGETWTGFYLYGRETFVELYGPSGADFPPGATGIGLSVDRLGGLERVAGRLEAGGIKAALALRQKEADGKSIPWFRYLNLTPDPNLAAFTLWVSESMPEFMAQRLAPTVVAHDDVSRRTYLSTQYQPDHLLVDVRVVELIVSPSDGQAFAAAMTALGWPVRREGSLLLAEGPGTTLRVEESATQRGLKRLEFSLSWSVARQEVPLGSHSTQVVGPWTTASWIFTPCAVP
jgi:hypothetical protein